MTLTTKPHFVFRIGRVLLGAAILQILVWFLLWGAVEGHKFVGR
jgi:hypothetical protein